MKVLHITDCLNGGVRTGIEYIVENHPSSTHYLLWSSHSDTPEESIKPSSHFYQTVQWGSGPLNRIRNLLQAIKEIDPDIIHAHSSYAGLFVRVLIGSRRIFYSPHCFAFERRDVNQVFRLFFVFVEFILSFRTEVFFCNWPNEYAASKRLSKFSRSVVTLIPLFDLGNLSNSHFLPKKLDTPIFGNVGRLRPQKDPNFFKEVARQFNSFEKKAQWVWLGDGDMEFRNALLKSDVRIERWSKSDEVQHFYQHLTCLVVTSAWESGPLTLIESLIAGTTVVLRKNSSSNGFGISDAANPNEMVSLLRNIVSNLGELESLFYHHRDKISSLYAKYGEKLDPYK